MGKRIRTQKLKEPVAVEINYDPNSEKLAQNQDMRDIRFVRVRVPKARLVADAARVQLLAPEGSPGDACPVGFHSPPVFPAGGEDGIVEFKLHLVDTALATHFGGSVEQAAVRSNSSPLPFRIVVGIDKQEPSDPDNVERPGALTINLNRISWTWQRLVWGKEGWSKADNPVPNDPIEVALDGTDQNGFWLELKLEKRQPNGEYAPASADFTHYLAPAEHKIDNSILEPVPRPEQLEGSQRQIETVWRTATLEKDAPILARLPVETTLRVRAYPGESIRHHHSGGAPETQPPDLAALAVREIPLRLGLRKWRIRLLTKELLPGELPLLLTGRPWEEGIRVEFEVFDDSGEKVEYLRQARLKWQLRADPEAQSRAGGKVLGSSSADQGDWQTDDAGKVSFLFAPDRQNALLFAAKENLCFHAAFDVSFPDADNQPGKKIPPADPAGDDGAPAFRFGWAPKFDLGVLKLPFFSDPATPLDLEAEPDESSASLLALGLDQREREYRELFARGGQLRLACKVTDPGGEHFAAFEEFLAHARVCVGPDSLGAGEQRELVDFESLGGFENASVSLRIPAPPNASSGEGIVFLGPKIQLHPDIRSVLQRVAEACAPLEGTLATCEQIRGSAFYAKETNFRELAAGFFKDALGYFCSAERDKLVKDRKAIRATLGAMLSYLQTTREIWLRLGGSVAFHRTAYKRMEQAMLNFFYDFIMWSKVTGAAAKVWGALAERFKWLPKKIHLKGPTDFLHDLIQKVIVKSGIDAFARPTLQRLLTNLEKIRTDRFRALGYTAEGALLARDAGVRALATAETQAERAIAAVEQKVDELVELNGRIDQAISDAANRGVSAQAALQPLQAEQARLTGALSSSLDETGDALATLDRNARVRATTEGSYRIAQLEQRLLDTAEQRMKDGAQQLSDALESDDIDSKVIQKVMDDANKVPVEALVNQAKEEGLELLEQQTVRQGELTQRLSAKLSALNGKGLGFNSATPVGPGIDAGQLQNRIRQLESDGLQTLNGTQNALDEAQKGYQAKFAAAEQFHRAQKAINEEIISDAVKSGSHVGLELFKTIDGEVVVPPSSDSFADTLVDFFSYCVRSGLNLVYSGFAYVGGKIFAALALLARIFIVFPLSLLLKLTARFGGKVCEVLVIVLQNTMGSRGAVWPTSALQAKALEAGLAELRQSSGVADEFFAFPYSREQGVLERMNEAAANFVLSTEANDKAVEEFVDSTLKAGYEDYYPSQLQQAHDLLHGLCRRALARETIELAPCTTETGSRSLACIQAADDLGAQIDDFNRSAAAADGTGKGFFVPLGELVNHARWNSATLESIADWCGWIIGWAFRIGALVLAIASWWFPPGLALSATMIALAASSSAITAIVRILLSAVGFYPYSTAYPRDLMALQGAHFASLFRAEGERLDANAVGDFVKPYPK